MGNALRLAIEEIEFYMRNVKLRLPFRYGKACLVAAPLLHTRLRARGEDGSRVTGVCADMLPPKWFDKSADKSFEDNIHDLLHVARLGRVHYLAAAVSPASVFEIWHRAYRATHAEATAAGFNGLTASFGSSIVERAVIDAACKLAQTDFFTMAKENGLGIDASQVHSELTRDAVARALPEYPMDHVYVRHTVGLGDPLDASDLIVDSAVTDGLPQTLEEWTCSAGIRYFKIKVLGDAEKDLARIRRIVEIVRPLCRGEYFVTLDGNEQFHAADELAAWLDCLAADPLWPELRERILYIEQPIERAVALERPLGALGRAPWPPIIIDESDGHLNALKDAIAQGYRGTSVKNCKGVIHALLNNALIGHYNAERGGGFILSSEDLCNQPLIPLQQDLCTLSVLGVEHAERNGHHYVGTLGHIPRGELDAALSQHRDLYEPFGTSARLRIREGRLALGSLGKPGYATVIEPDWASMVRADAWEFGSLGIA